MDISSNSIDKLGERMRRNEMLPGDLDILDAYEAAYDRLLLEVSNSVDSLLSVNSISFLLAGRLKRPKSTIRKLKRDENRNMALSQMGDILGVRVIVGSISDQNLALEAIKRAFKIHDIKDYRNDGKIYRSLHVVVKDERLVEIQIRTIPQHVWAVESEQFGEKVKEGTLVGDEKIYLTELSAAFTRIDKGQKISEEDYPTTPLMKSRLPISGLHNNLITSFKKIEWKPSKTGNSFVVLFDNETVQLLHGHQSFSPDDRSAAIKLFQNNTRRVSELRYESLVFNAPSIEILKVTHPRFFL